MSAGATTIAIPERVRELNDQSVADNEPPAAPIGTAELQE